MLPLLVPALWFGKSWKNKGTFLTKYTGGTFLGTAFFVALF